MKKIDLHTHTTASDGILSPKKLIDFALESGIYALAITDHDTVDGLPEALEYAGSIGFRLIPGVELSIDYDVGSFHLVGLNMDHTNSELQKTVKRLSKLRENRACRIIEDLKRNNIDIPVCEVEELADSGSIGRPHIARVMVKHGYAANIKEVFKNYLVKGKPGYVKKERIGFDKAISVIKSAGGIPIIAHPISLGFKDFNEFENLLKDFIRRGVEGIEVYAPMHRTEEVEYFLKLADKYSLIVSGGSDFHGDKDEIIGYYAEERPIPIEIFYRLEEYTKES